MLKIRMQRTGRINMPTFRIVVIEHARSPKAGNFVEKVGVYNPKTKERSLNAERIKYWLSVGAKASGTVHNMLISAGITEGKKINLLPKKSPPKLAPVEASKEEVGVAAEDPATEEKEEATPEAPAKETTSEEAPAEETKSEPESAEKTE